MRPSTSNPSPRGHRRFRPNLSKIYQYDFVLATVSHPMLLHMLCGKWNARVDEKAYIWL
jgi:hypothetical protein